MKILFDHQIFFRNKFGGITKIFMIISRKLKTEDVLVFNSIDISNFENGEIRSIKSGKLINHVPLFSFYYFFRIYLTFMRMLKRPLSNWIRLLESGLYRKSLQKNISKSEMMIKNIIKSESPDIFHVTYYDDYFFEFWKQVEIKPKLIVTIHDCLMERFPGYFGLENFVIKNRKYLCEMADKIVCVSKFTRLELLKFYPDIDESKITVISNGGELSLSKSEDVLPFQSNYFLYIGNRSHYKNFSVVLDAFAKPDVNFNSLLICAGSHSFTKEEFELIESKNLVGKIIHLPIRSENFLANLYSNAVGFVYPSIYEGFGIPIVEAMSLGCPVLCSDIPPFKEVAGNSAIYFNPHDPTELESAMIRLMKNENIRNKYKKLGLLQSKNYTWENCALEYKSLYESLT